MEKFDLSREKREEPFQEVSLELLRVIKNDIFSPRTILDNIFDIFIVSQQLSSIFIFF